MCFKSKPQDLGFMINLTPKPLTFPIPNYFTIETCPEIGRIVEKECTKCHPKRTMQEIIGYYPIVNLFALRCRECGFINEYRDLGS